jgi:hypothetical protein
MPPQGRTGVAEQAVPYTDGMDYGVGIDTPSGAHCNTGVLGEATTIPDTSGSIVDYSMRLVDTEEDLHTRLGISASASGGVGLFSASARLDFSKDCKFNSHSVFFVVRISVRLAFASIKAPMPSPTAIKMVEKPGLFRHQFGDMFVRGLRRGGVYFGVVEIRTTDATDQQNLSLDVSAAYGPFSAEGKFSESFTNVVKNRNINITVHQEGGDISPRPTTLDQLQTVSSNWASSVEHKAVAYGALLDTYDILDLPEPPTYIDLEHQKDVLARCAALRNQDWQLVNDVDYILGHPNQFEAFDADALHKAQHDLGHDLEVIKDAASFALDHPRKAAFPQDLNATALSLPRRLEGQPSEVPNLVVVPDFVHYDTDPGGQGSAPGILREAEVLAGNLGLHFNVTIQNPDAVPDDSIGTGGTITSQYPPAGTEVPRGSGIHVIVWID